MIITSKPYNFSPLEKDELTDEEDKYIMPKGNADALPYLMLDIMRDQSIKTSYEEKFAVVLSMTLKDCLEYAHKFDE